MNRLNRNINFEKFEKIDDYTCKIVFHDPGTNFIPMLSRCWLYSKNHLQTNGEENGWWSNTIASGMYKVESIIQGDRYVLVKNDNYWKDQKAVFDKIIIRYYAEASTMYIDYETGVLDMISSPLAVDIKRIINGDVPNTICEIWPMLTVSGVVFNEEKRDIWYNENLRKAVFLALDSAVISKLSYDFLAQPGKSMFSLGITGRYEYEFKQDIEGAKQALADAGYKPGELTIIIGTNTNNVNMAFTEAIQSQLNEVGFDCQMLAVEASANINNLRNTGTDTYDLAVSNVSFYAMSPAVFLTTVSKTMGSTSMTSPTDDKIEELAVAAKAATTTEEQIALLEEIQKYVFDHYWMHPTMELSSAIVYKDYLTGVRAVAGRCPIINDVTIVN